MDNTATFTYETRLENTGRVKFFTGLLTKPASIAGTIHACNGSSSANILNENNKTR